MKPRQPYRSPFWRPDSEPHASFGRDASPGPVAPPPARPVPPQAPPQRRPERASGHANTYAQSDLALFGRLMDAVKRGPSARPADELESPRPHGRATPDRKREPSVRSEALKDYTSRDMALFQSLQPPSSGRQPPFEASRPVPSPPLSVSTHGYSQADLDAFDKLTRFGRSS